MNLCESVCVLRITCIFTPTNTYTQIYSYEHFRKTTSTYLEIDKVTIDIFSTDTYSWSPSPTLQPPRHPSSLSTTPLAATFPLPTSDVLLLTRLATHAIVTLDLVRTRIPKASRLYARILAEMVGLMWI